jgi:hypothetical protein
VESVQRRAASSTIKKTLRCEPVKLDCGTFASTCPVTLCRGVRRNILFVAAIGEQGEQWTARFTSTTLVLESCPPDFSTEAGNSDLIADNEILAQLQLCRKTKTSWISGQFRLAY